MLAELAFTRNLSHERGFAKVAGFGRRNSGQSKTAPHPIHSHGQDPATRQRTCGSDNYAKAIESLTNALAIEQEQNDVTRQATTLSNLMGVWKLRSKRRLAIFFGKMAINTMQSTRRNVRKLERRLPETYLHSVQDRYRELADLLVSEGRIPEGEQVLRLLKEEEHQDFVRSETANSASGGVPLTAVDRDWQQRFNAIQNQIATIGKDYAELVSKESRNDEENRRLEQLEDELALANKALDPQKSHALRIDELIAD